MQQVQQVRAKQKSLQDIQDNYTGFYQGVKIVLQNKEKLSGIVGAVAELIQVPAEYTLAIETAGDYFLKTTPRRTGNLLTYDHDKRTSFE